MTATPPPEQTHELQHFADALAGQYDVLREIGRGGMGVVYLARDARLDRPVAIKTLPPHLASDPVVRERFLREARTAARLTHQNIVAIHRADEAQGRVFFVMGFVDGDSLAQRIRDRGRLEASDVVRYLRDVASALGYAHANGIIHRDVKAENILLDRVTGRAMVTDFGIARLAEATPLTSTGQVLGTVYYLSPEQVSGESVDARSDIYSLGVVGYLALSGRFPFDAELASAVLIAHVTKSAPPLHTLATAVPRALADIIDRCLAKDAAERFQTCDDLIASLDELDRRDLDVPTTLPAHVFAPRQPALISDTEAQSILGRAADLQAKTGIQPRPSPIALHRDADRDAARTSGYRPTDVRDAAVEAGIGGKYIDHAMEEHGLARTGPSEMRPAVLTDRGRAPHPVAGGRTQLEYEIVVDGEMPDSDYDLLADIVRQATGEAGNLAAVGRSFSWHVQQPKRNLQVSVLSRHGKTTIRVSESLGQLAGVYFGGILGGIGGGSLGIVMGVVAGAMHNPVLGLWTWGGVLATCFLGARLGFSRASRKRDNLARSLAERLADQAKESIAAMKALKGE